MSSESSYSDPQERRQETLENNGFSHYTAEIALGKVGVTSTAELPPVKTPSRRPHVSHRGGRSLPEESGRDVARRLANQDALEHPFDPTPEEKEAIQASISALRQTLRAARIRQIIDDYDQIEGNEPYITARIRADKERDNK